jgi:signal transduction histidine kinase
LRDVPLAAEAAFARQITRRAMPRLPTFIRENTEAILVEWESFARSVETDTPMDIAALRDHAKEMLGAIASDLDAPQTNLQRADKSQGKRDAHMLATRGARQTAAQQHGAGRATSGFTVEQMISEFRALRASVLHLWKQRQAHTTADDLDDITRFNESIDQAIAESITTYAREVRQSRDRFLAILGHDLRTPIGAIMTSTAFMLEVGNLPEPHKRLVTTMQRSARRMNLLVGDLLELTRTRMGDSIPIVRGDVDGGRIVRDVVAEVAASHPDRTLDVRTSGNLRGSWDCERLTQALINLVSNAVHHGAADRPITVVAEDAGNEVAIWVHNHGPAMDPALVEHLFDAMKDLPPSGVRDRRHLGLGLYVVHKIITAHGGRIDVASTEADGTTFTVHLPRGVVTAATNHV